MFKMWLFLHLTGISIWVGSLLAVIFILFMMKRHLGSKELATIVKKIVRIVNILVHPSAFIVLLSGIFMIVMMNFGDAAKPFWLTFMERFGGGIILFTMIAVGFVGRSLVKKLRAVEGGEATYKHSPSFTNYILMMTLSVVSVIAIIFVVSFRF